MKSFAFCAIVLAVSAVVSADFANVVRPMVANTEPIAFGIGRGLSLAAPHVNKGLRNAGSAVKDAAEGVASAAVDTAEGVGAAVKGLPGTAYQIVSAIADKKGLTADIKPFLEDITPVANGVAQGITNGVTDTGKAVVNVGSAVEQIAEAIGDAAQGAAVGTATAIKDTPEAVYKTLVSLAHDSGILGKIDRYL